MFAAETKKGSATHQCAGAKCKRYYQQDDSVMNLVQLPSIQRQTLMFYQWH